ncbi:hypothetical protein Tsubulata_038691 [Turnera subulata]|uniref:C2 domain-containing protein n=1 Tax=Turnera subulata TaxID=218843 RepID=A0A9Q0FB04_9ROSI|nr:hypothetical protein Tsubulata_038691 [Turnera subulata]
MDDAATSSRSLEITVLSAENLCINGKPVKKNAFAVVKVDPLNLRSTKADYERGGNPSWNEKLKIDMPMHARFLTLEVKCRIGSVDRVIGTANLPISDLVADYTPENLLHFLSYRLKDPKGEKNGIINVSARVNGPILSSSYVPFTTCRKKVITDYGCSSSSSSSSSTTSRPTIGVPVSGMNYHHSGVVTGVPVWG